LSGRDYHSSLLLKELQGLYIKGI